MSRPPHDRRPTRAGQPWTDHEDRELLHYAASGLTAQEIAQLLRRSIAAVKTRAQIRGVPLPANTRRPIPKKKE